MVATRAIDSDIRPISDLRNKFAEIADYVQGGRPVIFNSQWLWLHGHNEL